MPVVNWALMVAVLALVSASARSPASPPPTASPSPARWPSTRSCSSSSSARLGEAAAGWRISGAAAFLIVDLLFFAANLTKVFHGGWFPLMIAFIVFTVLITWQRGREIVTRNRRKDEGPLRDFVEQINEMDPPVDRVPGTAVFLNSNQDTTPLALRANVVHNQVMHESVVIATIKTANVPHVSTHDRLKVDDLGFGEDGISHLTINYGFQDSPDVPEALRHAEDAGLECKIDVDHASYFLSQIKIVRTEAPGMRRWRKKLFLATAQAASNPAEYFGLPEDRTIVMGSYVDV